MDLQDPTKKMSKSESDKGCILLLDPLPVIRKKIMSAVTDSETVIRYDREKKPGISNLLAIYATLTGKTIETLEEEYKGKGYGEFKQDLADVVVDYIRPIQERFNEIRHSQALDDILNEGAEKASQIARKTMDKVLRKVGLLRR